MRVTWRRLALVPLLCVLPAPLFPAQVGQSTPAARAKPLLIGKCVGNCLYDTVRQEYAFALADAARYSRLAVRLCSAERFEVAIAKAKDNLYKIADELKRWPHVKLEEIALLLARDCRPAKAGRVATEFWEIPPAAPMPAHVRNVRLTSAAVEVVRAGQTHAQVAEFVRLLRENPDSYGVVLGRFFSRPHPLLRRRVSNAESLIRASGGLRGRYAAVLVPYGITFDGQVEPKEPSFLIIRIRRADAGEGRTKRSRGENYFRAR